MQYDVVLPCAGSGERMELGYNKMLYVWNDRMLLLHTCDVFLQDEECTNIIIVHASQDEQAMKVACTHPKFRFVCGGATRTDSVYAGLQLVSEPFVLVHDGARPFISQAIVHAVVAALREYPAVLVGVPCIDTIKVVRDGMVKETPQRSELWMAQTPQAFHSELILHCYEKAKQENVQSSDDTSLVERYADCGVHIVMGEYSNRKVTTPKDLEAMR